MGWRQKAALIRFYLKKDVEKCTIDEAAKYTCEITYLLRLGALNIKMTDG